MSSDYYTLDAGGEPIPCPDFQRYAEWFETAERHIGNDKRDGVHVSTVFLGMDHGYGDEEGPVLWETMIFGGPHNEYQERYTSRLAALAGHQRALALAFP